MASKTICPKKSQKNICSSNKDWFKTRESKNRHANRARSTKPKQFRVGVNGKEAQTNYEVTESNDLHSTIILKPETGRTHQLRVHLKQLGYPIVGDILYGGEDYSRLMLHAKELELTLPNKHRQVFKAPLPSEFKDIMDL